MTDGITTILDPVIDLAQAKTLDSRLLRAPPTLVRRTTRPATCPSRREVRGSA